MKLALGVLALLLAVFAVVYYRTIVGMYWRRTGYASHIAALSTLVLVSVIAGAIAAAWGLSTLCLAPGAWRNALAVVLYSVLMGVLGKPLIAVATGWVRRWYYM